MRSDFDLIVHNLPRCQEARIYFIGDLHAGAIEADIRGWEGFCKRILEEPNSYLCLMGDLMNNATKSSVSNVFEDTMRPAEQKRYLANALKPLRERILSAVAGNHEMRSGKDADDDPMYDIMSKLDLEDYYRPNAAFVKLAFGERQHGGNLAPMQTYVICTTHGAGGGIYTGAAVNRNERFATSVLEGVDILAVGHTHKGTVSKPSKICVDSRCNSIVQKSMTVISVCSWMGYGGYAMRKMLLPSAPQDPDQPQYILLGCTRRRRYIKTVW